MIDVITPERYAAYSAELYDMYRLRHRVFRERLKWDVTSRAGLELDEFDDLSPIYLVAGDGWVNGTWRLLPTTGPYMLSTVFAEVMEDRPPPNDAAIWETSRFAVDAGPSDTDGLAAVSRITSELFCGLVEYCMGQGITEILTLYDVRIARLLGRVGCTPSWQSRRHRIGGTIGVAGRFDINESVLADLRAAGGITESVLREPRAPVHQHAA